MSISPLVIIFGAAAMVAIVLLLVRLRGRKPEARRDASNHSQHSDAVRHESQLLLKSGRTMQPRHCPEAAIGSRRRETAAPGPLRKPAGSPRLAGK
jgi:hypothetical protein